MKSTFVITMWSGGQPAKKWKSGAAPRLLESGNGIEFENANTRLSVRLIGNISVEEFESGKEELEGTFYQTTQPSAAEYLPPDPDEKNIRPLF